MKSFYTSLFLPLALVYLLLGTVPAQAQLLWQRTVGRAAEDESGEYMVPVAGGFVTLGKANGTTAQPDQALYLSKVDYNGDTLWTRRWPFRRVELIYPTGLMADAAGNLVISAITLAHLATPTAPPPPNQGLLVKLTATGDTLWSRTRASSGSNASGLLNLVLGNDNNYVVIGTLATLPVLAKYSPAGVLLWNQVILYNTTRPGYLQNLVAVPNGYLLLSSPNGGNLPSKFITVDEQGAFQLERLGARNVTNRLQRDSQGNILAIGGRVTKLTPIGDTIWSYSYRQVNQPLALSRLVETPTGNYLAVGTRYNGLDDDIGIMLLDRNGLRLRDTLLVRFQSQESVAGVALTPARDYVVAGGTDRGQNGRSDQLVFALRKWDRLLPTHLGQPIALAQLVAYPNPTADEVTFMTAELKPLIGRWTLYDMLGRSVQSGSLSALPYGRLSLAQQPTGLYLLRVSDERSHTIQTLRLEKI